MGSGPTLVVTCGLPGVGKTTVARALADRTDAVRHRTDVVRKDLFDDPDYTEAETRAVYDELLDRARRTLEAGDSVVLDGTFKRRRFRRQARETAASAAADASFRLVKVECAESVVVERIRARTDDESDADVAVYRMHRDSFEPVEMAHDVVDNSGDLAATRRQVADLF